MTLDEFLDNNFVIYFADNNPNMIISTTDKVKKHTGFVDKKNPPKEDTLVMPKKEFAEAFKFYADALGYKELIKHPARFCKDYALDLLRGEVLTPASLLIKEWLNLGDHH